VAQPPSRDLLRHRLTHDHGPRLLAGAGLGILAVATANDVSNNLGNGGYTNRGECMASPETTTAQCNALSQTDDIAPP